MNKQMIYFYESIKKERITNRVDSKYWIYHVESIITKRNGMSKRYLKVMFFNRFMNEQNNLMRLTLNVNDEIIDVDNFVMASEYNNPNIMGFLLEKDLIDDSKNVEIVSYVENGKKVDLSDKKYDNFLFVNNEKKLNVLKKYTNDNEDSIIAPYFDDEKWICGCGCCNNIEDNFCQVCGKSKLVNKEYFELEEDEMILSRINDMIKVTDNEKIETTIKKIANKLNESYGISLEKTYSVIDLEQLKKQQDILIEETITKYIESNELQIDENLSFKESLLKYIDGICNEVITKQEVMSHLNVDMLRIDYEDRVLQMKQERKNKKSKRIIAAIVATLSVFLIVVGIYAIMYFTNPQRKIDKEASLAYENAMTLYNDKKLDEALNGFKNIDSEWSEYEKVEEIIKKINLEQKIEKISNYLFEDDLKSALNLYNENISDLENDPIAIEINNAINDYKDKIIDSVQNLKSEKDYANAIEKLTDAIELLNGNEELENKLKQVEEDYEKIKPVLLSSLSAYVGELDTLETCTDNLGNKYYNCFLARRKKEDATYFLDRKYNTFTGTLAVTKPIINEYISENNIAIFRVIADKKVIYEKTLYPTSKPIKFSLDITGVKDLKIEMKGEETNFTLSDGLYLILGEAQVQKVLK